MRRILPILLGLVGLAGGAGAGLVLRPHAPPVGEAPSSGDQPGSDPVAAPAAQAAATPEDDGAPAAPTGVGAAHTGPEGQEPAPAYVRLNNQFIVPVIENGRISATVVLSLSLEVPEGTAETVYAREPRLRDAFLRVLFDHANAGGFRGVFTDGANLLILRRALTEAARKVLGDTVSDVLIADLVRQDA